MSEPVVTPAPRRPRPSVVTLTPAAADRVRELLAANPDKIGLKIGVKNGGCAGQEYVFSLTDVVSSFDEAVDFDGARVVIEGKAILYLIGTEIDWEVTPLASKFVFRNPNQTDACGCGESVTITPASAD
ncbi:MAG: iron-sulfur cluster assembly accessory protein [Alphaproteobacteria bacterium]|nr:iron-sulfur cluster assembly accessory protein [Alphaproteobacteria bacterium]MBU1526321.1 iron-sulfur cluster assembly accessory protein [Alphaproteobacteria bacterium]MBU2116236.1 iron-sulfur cluster assembly accessory protein [Alphaproteobacteria bacterium]MBU2351791.1 iron-sulfur cluster assembly accessory protein [Alphaproteobacteria bacterium]MBU2382057.1 iron-sulfur cluster assembly accessory protein [Alphaproteobacteria bacterium]